MMEGIGQIFSGACPFWVVVEIPGQERKLYGFTREVSARLAFWRHASTGLGRVRLVSRLTAVEPAARAA